MSFEKSQPAVRHADHLMTAAERARFEAAESLDPLAEDLIGEDDQSDATPEGESTRFVAEGAVDIGSSPQAKAPEPEEEPEEGGQTTEKVAADLEEVRKRRRQEEIDQLKADPEVAENSSRFLLEISGISPFTLTYEYANVLHMRFQTLSSHEREEIDRQGIRDAAEGRDAYQQEYLLTTRVYRQALSLAEFRVVDPVTQKVVLAYGRDTVFPRDQTISKQLAQELQLLDTDLYPRRVSQYLRTKVITTQRQQEQVARLFQQFELVQGKLLRLLELDPDFFTGSSSPAS